MFTFSRLTESHLPQVLKWRTSEEVTQFMVSDVEHDAEKQRQWFEKISADDSCRYWVIETERPIGVINLADIDTEHCTCSWGFYVGDVQSKNLGGLVPPYLYNFIFNNLSIDSLIADVMEHNTQVKKLHKLHGYRDEGLLEEPVVKNAAVIPLRRFRLSKEQWLKKTRFHRYIAAFEE